MFSSSARTHTHTHTHTHTTICMLTRTHVPAWELQDDVMPGRPTRACGETQYMWEPHHFRADPSPRCRRRLISCPSPPWGRREPSQQMGLRLVTFSVARSDYINSGSGSETHSCLMLSRLAFHLPSQPKTG